MEMVELPGSGANGVNVTAVPVLLIEYVPASTPLDKFEDTVMLELLTVDVSMPSLKLMVIALVTATPVALLAGLTDTTEGFVVSATLELPVTNPELTVATTLPA